MLWLFIFTCAFGNIKDKTTWEGRADQDDDDEKAYNTWEVRGFNDLFFGDSDGNLTLCKG